MPKYILPLLKSPNPAGRVGPRRWQDWYVSCYRATLLAQGSNTIVLVVSGFIESHFDEAECYKKALEESGVANIVLIREGMETIGQLESALGRLNWDDSLTVIASLPHWPRVWWLTHHDARVQRQIVVGIPRPKELVTDLILAIAFPMIDSIGLRGWWLGRIESKRAKGKI